MSIWILYIGQCATRLNDFPGLYEAEIYLFVGVVCFKFWASSLLHSGYLHYVKTCLAF